MTRVKRSECNLVRWVLVLWMAFLDTVTSSSPIALRKCVPDTQNQIRKFELKKFLTVHVTQSLHVTKTSHVTSQRSPHRVSCKAQKAEASMVERLTPEVKRQQMEQDYQNYKKQFQEVQSVHYSSESLISHEREWIMRCSLDVSVILCAIIKLFPFTQGFRIMSNSFKRQSLLIWSKDPANGTLVPQILFS